MTYLQLINGVLSRMREDTIEATAGESDVVALLVMDLVNDAKRNVEDAHRWEALRREEVCALSDSTTGFTLTGAVENATIEDVYSSDGRRLQQQPLSYIRQKLLQNPTFTGPVMYYAVKGVDAVSGAIEVETYPQTAAADTVTVFYYARQADLSADTDRLLVPAQPVLYMALALAARERGEVGGQTAAELFMMANSYLSDAIALDAAMNNLDDIWVTV